MLAIYKKELRSYFTSMMGYVFIALFLAIIGIYFSASNLLLGSAKLEYTLTGITFIFILLIPLLTMRLMAEENKQKTDQLLLTSPLSTASIAAGKLFAVFTVLLIVMGVVCFFPLILSLYGTINYAAAYASILGFILMGAAYLAIGLFISSLTESQVVAAIITFVVFILTLLMDYIASILPKSNKSAVIVFTVILIVLCIIIYRMMKNMTLSIALGMICEAALLLVFKFKPTLLDGSLADTVGWLSVTSRYNSFGSGTFSLSSVVYFLSVTFLFTFLTAQVIKKKRWS